MSDPRRLLGVAILAASLAACSGPVLPGPSDVRGSGPISQIDACALLTPAEIEAAVGTPIGPGLRQEASGTASGCDWEGENPADAVAITLNLDEFDQEFWDAEKDGEGVEPMPGIGEEAIRGWITSFLLLIKHRNMEIALTVVHQDDSVVKSAQETLGKLVVSRL